MGLHNNFFLFSTMDDETDFSLIPESNFQMLQTGKQWTTHVLRTGLKTVSCIIVSNIVWRELTYFVVSILHICTFYHSANRI